MDINDILGEITPRERVVPICTRGDLTSELEQLELQLKALVTEALADPPEKVALAARVDELVEQASQHLRQFKVQAIGPAYRELLAQYPPPPAALEQGYDHDPATFPIAAVAASCVDPQMTVEQAAALKAKLSEGQWQLLWSAVLDVNMGSDSAPKSSLATVILRASERKSTLPASSESPEESSLADG